MEKKKNRVVEATTGKMILGKMHNGIPIEYSTGSTRDSSTTRFWLHTGLWEQVLTLRRPYLSPWEYLYNKLLCNAFCSLLLATIHFAFFFVYFIFIVLTTFFCLYYLLLFHCVLFYYSLSVSTTTTNNNNNNNNTSQQPSSFFSFYLRSYSSTKPLPIRRPDKSGTNPLL